jgi:hypothetical protein
MIKAGIEMGIEENLSKLFVKQTMLGAYHLINNSDKSLEELIKDVASKGGTTEAALKTFEDNSFKEILKQESLMQKNGLRNSIAKPPVHQPAHQPSNVYSKSIQDNIIYFKNPILVKYWSASTMTIAEIKVKEVF